MFSVRIKKDRLRLFQFVVTDKTQLNSDVTRVFEKTYSSTKFDLNEVVSDKVDFHAHVIIPLGLRGGVWKNEGHVSLKEKPEIFFRTSRDFGNSKVEISENWEIWKVNEAIRFVGKLPSCPLAP